jgi:hypothetical protein
LERKARPDRGTPKKTKEIDLDMIKIYIKPIRLITISSIRKSITNKNLSKNSKRTAKNTYKKHSNSSSKLLNN